MPRMTGGEATVQALLAQGIDTLFVLPGVQNDALFSALYEAVERLRMIVTRHEQAAGYMAFGYAAASGRPGAYCVVPGPGFLNTTAALATAYACNAPVLCLSGQVPLRRIGRGFGLLHELPDQLGIMQRLTKWAARIETPQDAAAEVIRVQNAYPEVSGWAMIGGWPLFTQTLLTDLDPKKVKIVAGGRSSPADRKASTMSAPCKLSRGGRTQGSPTKSASFTPRRRSHLFLVPATTT